MLESKKAINFDLSDVRLRKYYPSNNYKKAWSDIKSYLLDNGFNHRQYSGYISKEPVTMDYVIQHIIEMALLFQWLKYCVKEFDVTIVGDEYSLKNYIYQENNFIQNRNLKKFKFLKEKIKILSYIIMKGVILLIITLFIIERKMIKC